MSRFDPKKWSKKAAGVDTSPSAEGEAQHPYTPGLVGEEPASEIVPVFAYTLERDGGGWRPCVYRIDPRVLVQHGELVHTHEPDMKVLAVEQIMRHVEERSA